MIFLAVVATALSFVYLRVVFTLLQGSRWVGVEYYRPYTGGWAEAYLHGCERTSKAGRLPEQPINTWTNLAYVFVGWLSGDPWFAGAMTLLGIWSALYHATSTSWAGWMDVTLIYVVFAFLTARAVVSPAWAALFAIVVGTVLGIAFHHTLEVPVGLSFVVTLLACAPAAGWWTVVGAGLFGLGYFSWWLDHQHRFPQAAGHGTWHVLTAIGFFCLHMK